MDTEKEERKGSAPLRSFAPSASLRSARFDFGRAFALIYLRFRVYWGIRLRQGLTWADETGQGRNAVILPSRQHSSHKIETNL
jgi:hypothetical protein